MAQKLTLPTEPAAPTGPPTINISMAEIQALAAQGKLKEARELLETKKLLEDAFKAEAAKEEHIKRQIESLAAIEREIQEKMEAQDNCPHIKEDGKPALAGQRCHDGQPVLICLNCNKEFRGWNAIPRGMMIKAENIGGIQG
jgi:hypothetical protein